MWKIAAAFAIFAAFVLYLLGKGGDIDMSGEKHGDAATHPPEAVAPAGAASAAK